MRRESDARARAVRAAAYRAPMVFEERALIASEEITHVHTGEEIAKAGWTVVDGHALYRDGERVGVVDRIIRGARGRRVVEYFGTDLALG